MRISGLFFLLFVIHTSVLGQAYKLHPLLSPLLQTSAEYLAPSEVREEGREHGFTRYDCQLHFPLYIGKDWLRAEGETPLFAVLAGAGASLLVSQGQYLDPDRALTKPVAGITALAAYGKRNLYLLQAGCNLPTEKFNVEPLYLRYSGTVMWRHLHRNGWWHSLGITYTPVYGNEKILPLLGIGKSLGRNDQLQACFPYSLSYSHRFNESLVIQAQLIQEGFHYLLNPAPSGAEDYPIYRQWQSRIGLTMRWYSYRHLILLPEIGIALPSNLKTDDIRSEQISTAYARVTLQYRFGNRPAAAPILDFDPGLNAFTPNYIGE